MGGNQSLPALCQNYTEGPLYIEHNASDYSFIRQYNQILYGIIMPMCVVIGLLGNILNVITLRSRTLQTVPFIYIRCIAYFDLTALTILLVCSLRVANYLPKTMFYLTFYQTHIELPALNSFLQGSLYVACILTVERFLLIIRPMRSMQNRASNNPRTIAKLSSICALMIACLLHFPMTLQYQVFTTHNTRVNSTNSVSLHWTTFSGRSSYIFHCQAPYYIVFTWYERVREGVRIGCVLVMSVLNVIITHQLHVVKTRKKSLTVAKHSNNTVVPSSKRRRSTATSLLNSFSEQRLTVMMTGITVLYVLGNAPQSVVMMIQEASDEMDNNKSYQIFRGLANLAETINHCMNFYVFCITSKEYSSTFLHNCLGVKRAVQGVVSRMDVTERTLNHSLIVQRPSLVALSTNPHNSSYISDNQDLVFL